MRGKSAGQGCPAFFDSNPAQTSPLIFIVEIDFERATPFVLKRWRFLDTYIP